MEYNSKLFYENYELILLTKEHIKTLFEWNIKEEHFEYYTCRPVKLCESFDEYNNKLLKSIAEKKELIYVLVKTDALNIPLGKITLFDLNPRNHSAEFGYYLPNHNRGKGLGRIIISKFIEKSLNNDELNLNKLYMTRTNSNHVQSFLYLYFFTGICISHR